jgi:hypothetical protein
VVLKGNEIVKAQYLKYILPYKQQSEKEHFRHYEIDGNNWTS